ncbi:phage tail protein [Niveispirillum fermenti]|uniref:phage tail protein n=1 Tax=Niveispirillum fermenti TaxID=1233113 RepID=UPI003A849E52
MDAYLGLIFPFAGTFAPMGTAQCWGQALPVGQNQALYSIITTIYGGNGNPNFNLPDLRGRVLMGSGTSPYLNQTINPGSSGGTASTVLTQSNLPLHNHAATFTPAGGSSASTINANVTIPIGTATGNANAPVSGANYLGGAHLDDGGSGFVFEGPYTSTPPGAGAYLQGTATGNVTVAGGGGTVAVQPGGGVTNPVPINNVQPFLAVTMYIVTMGLYPTRD